MADLNLEAAADQLRAEIVDRAADLAARELGDRTIRLTRGERDAFDQGVNVGFAATMLVLAAHGLIGERRP